MNPDEFPVKVYSTESSATHPGKLVAELWRDVLAGRELAWRLAVRDISAQYRQAALGLFWALMVLQFLMYVTPVVFPLPTPGWAATIFAWNPLTLLILTARDWLTGFPAEYLVSFLLVNSVVLLLLLLMGVVFRLVMPMLIERMGS